MSKDIAFEMAVSSVRYGIGVTREVGMDLAEMGAKNVMVLTDPHLARLAPVQTVVESLEQNDRCDPGEQHTSSLVGLTTIRVSA